jgi:hypothetical protein
MHSLVKPQETGLLDQIINVIPERLADLENLQDFVIMVVGKCVELVEDEVYPVRL